MSIGSPLAVRKLITGQNAICGDFTHWSQSIEPMMAYVYTSSHRSIELIVHTLCHTQVASLHVEDKPSGDSSSSFSVVLHQGFETKGFEGNAIPHEMLRHCFDLRTCVSVAVEWRSEFRAPSRLTQCNLKL